LFVSTEKKIHKGYQVVVGWDPKHLSEVAEGNGSVRLEPEVTVVVPGGQVTTLPEEGRRVEEQFIGRDLIWPIAL